MYYKRELLTRSCDGRRVDLITVSSVDGIAPNDHEPLLSGLFPDNERDLSRRSHVFPSKEVVFISARVHPGEVPGKFYYHSFPISRLISDA
jgi:hypothetical protein